MLFVFDWSCRPTWYPGRGNLDVFESSTVPHRKTCRRYNKPGDAHAFTFCCFRRQAFLSKDGSRRWLIEAIG
jgi:hypothetical protein